MLKGVGCCSELDSRVAQLCDLGHCGYKQLRWHVTIAPELETLYLDTRRAAESTAWTYHRSSRVRCAKRVFLSWRTVTATAMLVRQCDADLCCDLGAEQVRLNARPDYRRTLAAQKTYFANPVALTQR
jgi:hypothetical protein